MLKKALLGDENRNQINPRTGFLQFNVKTKKVCRCFASFSSDFEWGRGKCASLYTGSSV